MAPLPIVFGPSSSYGKFGFDGSRRVVNAYAVANEGGGKGPFVMYAAPGLRPFVSLPTSGFRGGMVVNETAYVVYGRALYAVSLLGDVTQIGGVPGDGYVACATDGLADPHMLFAAGGQVYMLHSGQFALYAPDGLPPVVDLAFQRGRFLFGIPDGRWFYSDFAGVDANGNPQPLTVNALSFYNANSMPKGMVGLTVRRGEVWLMGTDSVEVWSPTDNVDDPFSPLGGGSLPYGCSSAASIAQNNDSIFWVDQNHQVRRTTGYVPEVVSPTWLSRLIEAEPDASAITAGVYAIDGQQFYEISGANFTARYNLAANAESGWTERQTVGMLRWRGQGALEFYGKTLVGDYATGDLWVLDKDYAFDGDQKVMVRLQSAITHAWPTPLSIYSLHADIIAGARNDNSDPELANPQIMLRMSEDGGLTFDGYLREPLWLEGSSGRVIWRQLGTYDRQGAVAEISFWAGVGKAFMGAIINGAAGTT